MSTNNKNANNVINNNILGNLSIDSSTYNESSEISEKIIVNK